MPRPDKKKSIVVHGVDAVPQIHEIGPGLTAAELLRELAARGYDLDVEIASVAIVDADGDLELAAALIEVVEDGSHVHVHRHCREIRVDVRFVDETKSHEFRSNRTVGTALAWAEEKFGIVPEQRGQYRLKLPTSNEYLPNEMLLGELVPNKPCEVKVDLVRAEQNAGSPDEGEVALLRDLVREEFMRGFIMRRWGPACIDGLNVIIPIRARSGHTRVLCLDLAGYPEVPPQGTFWDLQTDRRLAANLWPVLPGDNKAFRTDWVGGDGLYIACDRSALFTPNSHPEWAQTHTNTNWRPQIGIARYVTVVADLLDTASIPDAAA